MLISERIKLSKTPNRLILIEEGLFLRAYNQSAYIVTQFFDYDFTLFCSLVKKLNIPIVYCGFPKSIVNKRFCNAVKTPWGYEVYGEYDLSHYAIWFEQIYSQLSSKSQLLSKSQSVKLNTEPSLPRTEAANAATVRANFSLNLPLTPKQHHFLSTWQKGRFSAEVESAFLKSLQQNLKR